MQFKTISSANEKDFDTAINEAIAQGWEVKLETYRTAGWAHSGYESELARHGCYNSIILTKD